jgi:hypothetical protein
VQIKPGYLTGNQIKQTKQTLPYSASEMPNVEMKNLNLTFDIEIEFVAIFHRSTFRQYIEQNWDKPGPVDDDTKRRNGCDDSDDEDYTDDDEEVNDRDRISGFAEISRIGESDGNLAIRLALRARGIKTSRNAASRSPYGEWIVGCDKSVWERDGEFDAAPQGNELEWEAIEISSRKLLLDERGSLKEVSAVLEVLHKLEEQFQCRFLCNTTTGFHVHIGNKHRPIPLRTAKKVTQFGTAFARIMDLVHPAERIVYPDKDHVAPCNAPLSLSHLQGTKSVSESNVFDWLRRIEETATFEQLDSLFQVRDENGLLQGGHRAVYNFENLVADELKEPKGTIEF